MKCVSCSVVPSSLPPHGLQPTRLLCPWNSPGKNTGVGCHAVLQGIFLTQGSNPGLLYCKQIQESSYVAAFIIRTPCIYLFLIAKDSEPGSSGQCSEQVGGEDLAFVTVSHLQKYRRALCWLDSCPVILCIPVASPLHALQGAHPNNHVPVMTRGRVQNPEIQDSG